MELRYVWQKTHGGDKGFKSQASGIAQNVRDFSKQLLAQAEMVEGEYKRVMGQTYTDMFSTLVERTPIDTGNARKNWNIVVGSNTGALIPYVPTIKTKITSSKKNLETRFKGRVSRGVVGGRKKAGLYKKKHAPDVAKYTRKKIKEFVQEYTNSKAITGITIFNNAKHIKVLEDGKSDQAPNGMIAITIQDFTRYLKRAAETSEVFK